MSYIKLGDEGGSKCKQKISLAMKVKWNKRFKSVNCYISYNVSSVKRRHLPHSFLRISYIFGPNYSKQGPEGLRLGSQASIMVVFKCKNNGKRLHPTPHIYKSIVTVL